MLDVVEELDGLTSSSGPEAAWADKALGELDWLGDPVDLNDASYERAVELQSIIRGTRPLRHPREHWGEAAIITLSSQAMHMTPLMLSDDYNARVAAEAEKVKPVSVHKLLHLFVHRGRMSAATAAAHASALEAAGRCGNYTQLELQIGKLGRAGEP